MYFCLIFTLFLSQVRFIRFRLCFKIVLFSFFKELTQTCKSKKKLSDILIPSI